MISNLARFGHLWFISKHCPSSGISKPTPSFRLSGMIDSDISSVRFSSHFSPGMNTPQTERDHEELERRKRSVGPLFNARKDSLVGRNKNQLLVIARQLAASMQVKEPDRLCLRNREALICWFCLMELEDRRRRRQVPQVQVAAPDSFDDVGENYFDDIDRDYFDIDDNFSGDGGLS
jgi:hypothetical protein